MIFQYITLLADCVHGEDRTRIHELLPQLADQHISKSAVRPLCYVVAINFLQDFVPSHQCPLAVR